eukprot:1663818-Rhodomonas_salina.1
MGAPCCTFSWLPCTGGTQQASCRLTFAANGDATRGCYRGTRPERIIVNVSENVMKKRMLECEIDKPSMICVRKRGSLKTSVEFSEGMRKQNRKSEPRMRKKRF